MTDGKTGEMKQDDFMKLPDYVPFPAEEEDLYEYGIYTENSDIRAHVSPEEKIIYVFKTKNGIRAIEKNNPPIVQAKQSGYERATATGWLVKPKLIEDLRRLLFKTWKRWDEFSPKSDTTEKGRLAVECVLDVMRLGRFPIWIDTSEKDDKDIQIAGTDILIFCDKRVQVKCDYPIKKSGNLFLQKAEINPLKKY